MAGRRTSRTLLAREKARARTAELRAREQQLEDLATHWFEAEAEITEIDVAARRKVETYAARVRIESGKETQRLRATMAAVATRMLELDRVRSVAGRLGVPESELRSIQQASTTPAAGREEATVTS
ncbi:hypothetical protein N0X72_11990 [Streptomyces carpaticus]|uniref:hypothetical protein n=1 Tax=Streptomyces carpaticus TaxID=285558 RepID=UPI00220CFF3F|nr:hypothetical protein N0X72_11990 [Streptomyces carpaticus]